MLFANGPLLNRPVFCKWAPSQSTYFCKWAPSQSTCFLHMGFSRKLIKVPEKYFHYGTVSKYKSSTSYKELLNIAKFLKEPNTHRTTNGSVNNVGPVALRPTSFLTRRKHVCELSLKQISIKMSEKY